MSNQVEDDLLQMIEQLKNASASDVVNIDDFVIKKEEDLLTPDGFGNTLLMWAIKGGKLNQINPSLITERLILKENTFGNNAIHVAGECGCIADLPASVLTEDNFFKKNRLGATPLHHAANEGLLDKVPRQFLTKERMLEEDDVKLSPLHYAAYSGHINSIPKDFLTEEHLLHESSEGKTALGMAIEHAEENSNYQELKEIPRLLKTGTIKRMLGEGHGEFELFLERELSYRIIKKRLKKAEDINLDEIPQ